MIPTRLREHLRAHRVEYCVIGAHALALHGVARFTADVDLLTLDARVLDADFWPEGVRPVLRPGDDEDPLAGLVRFEEPAVDVVVGRGVVMKRALASASESSHFGELVVSPLWLAMLKLEAGGVQDLADVQLLVEARRRSGEDLRAEIASEATLLSDWGARAWEKLQRRLADEA